MSLCLTFNLSTFSKSLFLSVSLPLCLSFSLSFCLNFYVSTSLLSIFLAVSMCKFLSFSLFSLFVFFSLLDNYNLISADGTWAQWSTWSDCIPHCGDGKTMRERICLGQSSGGKGCEGENKQFFDCKDDATCTGS
jgi:hypothetical protein